MKEVSLEKEKEQVPFISGGSTSQKIKLTRYPKTNLFKFRKKRTWKIIGQTRKIADGKLIQ